MIIINSIGEIFEQIEVCLQEFWIFFFSIFLCIENHEKFSCTGKGFLLLLEISKFN
jgi:hypothetical protein